jgi:hypothetical protein
MNGFALDGSGIRKQLEVLPDNVAAFKAAGWVEGGLPEPEWSNTLGDVVYTLEDSIAQLADDMTVKRRGRKPKN